MENSQHVPNTMNNQSLPNLNLHGSYGHAHGSDASKLPMNDTETFKNATSATQHLIYIAVHRCFFILLLDRDS
jgi:hypothetical protein